MFKAGATLGANRVSSQGGRKEWSTFGGLRKFVNFENEKSIFNVMKRNRTNN